MFRAPSHHSKSMHDSILRWVCLPQRLENNFQTIYRRCKSQWVLEETYNDMNTYVTYCFASAGVETSTIETSVHCCCAQRCVHDWRQRECGNRYAGQHTQSPRQLRYRGECLANIYILHNQIIDSERLQLHLPSLHMNDMLQQLVICDSWAAHECCDTLHVSHWKERKSNRSIVYYEIDHYNEKHEVLLCSFMIVDVIIEHEVLIMHCDFIT